MKQKKHRPGTVLLAALLALCTLCAAGCGEKKQTPLQPLAPLRILVAADMHYLAPQLSDGGSYFQSMIRMADGKVMDRCEDVTDAFLEAVLEEAPDALILAGDLSFNGAVQSHTALAAKLQRLTDAGIRVLALPGNHDVYTGGAYRFAEDGYTPVPDADADTFATLYAACGYADALARDKHSLSYTVQLAPGLRVLLVDVNTQASPSRLSQKTLRWVKTQLRQAQAAGDRVLAVSHQNLLPHSPLLQDGFVMENSEKLLALYEEYGVLANLSGHIHLQHTAESAAGLPELVTSSLMLGPNRYGVLTLADGTLQYTTASCTAGELAEYSRQFFWESAYRQAFYAVAYPDVRDRMARFYADANAAYFAGTMSTLHWDTEALALWQKEPSFMTKYLESMAAEGFVDHDRYACAIP